VGFFKSVEFVGVVFLALTAVQIAGYEKETTDNF